MLPRQAASLTRCRSFGLALALLAFFVSVTRAADLEFPLRNISRIGAGSCHKAGRPNTIFSSASDLQDSLDLWLWLGDIVYLDKLTVSGFQTLSDSDMQAHWNTLKRDPEYKKLRVSLAKQASQNAPVISEKSETTSQSLTELASAVEHLEGTEGMDGTKGQSSQSDSAWSQLVARTGLLAGVWDDHDFGTNNGGIEFPKKDLVKGMLLDFLDEPASSPRRSRQGAYVSLLFGGGPGLEKRRVKVILLDVRYFRGAARHGDMLGDEQWTWLERELKANDADVTLIGSGIQILPDDKPIQEKWGNYPGSRDRLLRLVRGAAAHSTVVLLSGDVHYAELLQSTCLSPDYAVKEMTTSGITHSYATQAGSSALAQWILDSGMDSTYRDGRNTPFPGFNFGVVGIEWPEETSGETPGEDTPPVVRLEIRDENGTVVRSAAVSRSRGANSALFDNIDANPHCRPTDLTWPARWRLYPLGDWMFWASRAAVVLFCVFVVAAVALCKRPQAKAKAKAS
jgi:PhoD-like phosphatase